MTKITILVLLSTLVRFGASIRCFECNSANNSMCLEPNMYDAESVTKYLSTVTCSTQNVLGGGLQARPEDMFCRKMVQTILHKGHDPEVRVMRGCGWVKHHRACYKADNEDHLETVCQCFSDGCNGATTTQHTLAALVASVTVTTIVQ